LANKIFFSFCKIVFFLFLFFKIKVVNCLSSLILFSLHALSRVVAVMVHHNLSSALAKTTIGRVELAKIHHLEHLSRAFITSETIKHKL
jgi:hypothetical protein